jgi:hypothetical protein
MYISSITAYAPAVRPFFRRAVSDPFSLNGQRALGPRDRARLTLKRMPGLGVGKVQGHGAEPALSQSVAKSGERFPPRKGRRQRRLRGALCLPEYLADAGTRPRCLLAPYPLYVGAV